MTATIMYPNENMELSIISRRKLHVLSLHIHTNLSIKNESRFFYYHPALLFVTKRHPGNDPFPIRL